MASTYVHLSGRDIDNAILQANDQKTKESAEGPKLKILMCPRCNFSNPIDATYCTRCGAPLSQST
ncbi:MAG: zinc-ribbon domain-containing protein [Candidatus Micrarchaeaceae archaeon]